MKKAEYGTTVEPNSKLEKGRRQCSHKEGDKSFNIFDYNSPQTGSNQ